MKLDNRMMICFLLVLSFPALAAKAGGTGTIEIAENSTYLFYFNDLAEGDQIQYSFSAPAPIDVCFTTRSEAVLLRAGHSGECRGENVPFGQISNALAASGTFEIPNIREFDDDWAVVLTNHNNDEVEVTYQLDVIAAYVSGAKTSVQVDTFQQNGTQEIDLRGGAFGILFGSLKAGSTITYEFQATEPLDLYILTESEWDLLNADMGWEYAYADIETMQGNGRYPVPSDEKWVVAFVNYGKYHIYVSYELTVEASFSNPTIAAQTNLTNIQGESNIVEKSTQLQPEISAIESTQEVNQEINTLQNTNMSEDINQLKEPRSSESGSPIETNFPPVVPERIHYVLILVIIVAVIGFQYKQTS